MAPFWRPWAQYGLTRGGLGALWGAQAGPMCDFYKNWLHFHRFQRIFHDFRNDIHTVMASIYISFHIEFQEFQDVSGAWPNNNLFGKAKTISYLQETTFFIILTFSDCHSLRTPICMILSYEFPESMPTVNKKVGGIREASRSAAPEGCRAS